MTQNKNFTNLRDEYSELRTEYATLAGSGDNWGKCMGFWFDIAETLFCRGADIPAQWQYTPGALLGTEHAHLSPYSTPALVRFGNVLSRYSRLLRAAGQDY